MKRPVLNPVGYCGLAFLLVALAAGCAGKATIRGKVTYQGKPVTGGTITFLVGSEERSYPAQIQADGSFTIPEIRTGEAKITVTSSNPNEAVVPAADPEVLKRMSDQAKREMEKGSQVNKKDMATWRPLPKVYSDSDKTPLKITIQGGANQKDIDLQDNP
jgi:hypothetical protein